VRLTGTNVVEAEYSIGRLAATVTGRRGVTQGLLGEVICSVLVGDLGMLSTFTTLLCFLVLGDLENMVLFSLNKTVLAVCVESSMEGNAFRASASGDL
jgi:hypothetical protein